MYGPRVHPGEILLSHHLLPLVNAGVDRSAVPPPISIAEAMKEVAAVPGLQVRRLRQQSVRAYMSEGVSRVCCLRGDLTHSNNGVLLFLNLLDCTGYD